MAGQPLPEGLKMERDSVYSDYLLLRRMNANEDTKIHVLQRLVAQCTNNWRVVGITRNALQTFAESDFKPVSRSGIQRAHIIDRHTTFGLLIRSEFDQSSFWTTIADGDKTILATKGEYNKLATASKIALPDQGLFPARDEHIYFAARKVGFRCVDADRRLLRKLYNEQF